jgi:starvation-inducible outer membrane lipoprotein
MEIEREMLIAEGFDGRLVEYGNGEVDVIAFHLEQVTFIGMASEPGAAP